MRKCNCFCSIIPPHIMEELRKSGKVEITKEHLDFDKKIRAKRSAKTETVYGVAFTEIMGQAARKVYDCNHGTKLRVNLKRSESGAPAAEALVNTVYDNTGIIRDFYKNTYNFNSVDNHGLDLILNIHYSTHYNNAYWDGDEMIFGDGDGIIFTYFANSLDVTGHELTHGVVQHTAGLNYDGQSGALNEHYADVFGVTIRQFHQGQTNQPQTANWLVGDTVMGPKFQGQAIRSMKAPGTAYNNPAMGKDPQPDNMKQYYKGSDDNHGVHINSGIPNKLFYLVSVGFNDTLKAALLWFETLKTLQPNDSFAVFKTKMIKEVAILVTNKKIPTNADSVVKDAFKQVGL